jgi:hypothetical protein
MHTKLAEEDNALGSVDLELSGTNVFATLSWTWY